MEKFEKIFDYNSKKWERVRERALKRDGYFCQLSKRYGKRVPANTVHHIYPTKDYPEYAYCLWNLVSLSESMHNRMHARGSQELTEAGEALKRRTKIGDGQRDIL